MLKINKTINLSATSEIEGQPVVYMNASISTDGNTNANINKNVTNKELYDAKKDAKKFESFTILLFVIFIIIYLFFL